MSTIRLRRGTGAPTAGSFVEGEPAWDSTGKKLYIKASDGSMAEIGGGAGSTYTFASTAPASPSVGDTWTDADDGITYQYINDGDSSQWVELGPVGQKGSAGDPGAGVPEGGTTGQVLSKASATDYDTAWTDSAGGSTNLSYDAATRTIASDTGTDATLPLVTSSDAGLVPATGGGTTNFLRADGTFAAPPSGTDINGQTEVQSALDDELIIYDTSTSTNKKALVRDIGCQGMGGWGITPDRIVPFDTLFPSGVSTTFTVDRIYYLPILFVETKTFNTVQVVCRSSSSGGNVRVGLYTANAGPGSLVADYGKVTVSNGNLQFATNHTIEAGWYWAAFVTDDSSANFSRQGGYPAVTVSNQIGTAANFTFGTFTHLYENSAGSANNGLPSTATWTGGSGNAPIASWFNV